jgi:uncharacterized protein YkwD
MLRLALYCSVGVIIASTPTRGPAGKQESPQDRIVRLVNEFRASQKAGPLKAEAKLKAAAQKHAEALARVDKPGDSGDPHVLNGKNPVDRTRAEGYADEHVGENVGLSIGQADPVAWVVKGWQGSPGHRKNMLKPEWTETGVGLAKSRAGKWWFVQVFAIPSTAAAKPVVTVPSTPAAKPAAYVLLASQVRNAAQVAVKVQVRGSQKVYQVPPGFSLGLKAQAPAGANPKVLVDATAEGGATASFTVSDGSRHTITGDGKGIRVETAK